MKQVVCFACVLIWLGFALAACNDTPASLYEYADTDPKSDASLDGDTETASDGDSDSPLDGDVPADGDNPLDGDDPTDGDATLQCLRKVSENGFGDPLNMYAYAMAEFNGRLYVGTFNGEGGSFLSLDPSYSEGAEIWAYDGEAWEQVIDNGFERPANVAITTLTVVDDILYAGTANFNTGAEVWMTKNGENWTAASRNGLGNPDNTVIKSAVAYSEALFVGTENRSSGGEVYRIKERQVQLKGSGGLENPTNYSISAMTPYKGFIFVGTTSASGPELYRFTGETFTRILGIGDYQSFPLGHNGISAMTTYDRSMLMVTSNVLSGFGIFTTDDGINIEQLGEDGFGNSRLAYGWTFAHADRYLFLGTFNTGSLLDAFGEGSSVFLSTNGLDFAEMIGPEERWAGPGINNADNYGFPAMSVYGDRFFIGTAQCYHCNGRTGLEIWEVLMDDCL